MLDIIVPVFNEAGNIKRLLDTIEEKISCDKRILVIYDFDEDNTLPIIDNIKNEYSFEIILEKNEYGKGVINAIKWGFSMAKEDKILVVMADLSDRLEDVDKMIASVDEGYDLVCGSRYMRGGKQYGGPKLKAFLSRMAGLSLHFLTRIPTHDVTNSYKMYTKRVIDAIEIESNGGFEIGLEITVKAYVKGFRISEIATEWYDRTDGKSKFHMWKWMPSYLHWYFYCIMYTWFGRENDKG